MQEIDMNDNKSHHPTAPLLNSFGKCATCCGTGAGWGVDKCETCGGSPVTAPPALCECLHCVAFGNHRPASSEAKACEDECTEKNLAAKIHLSDSDAVLLDEFMNACCKTAPPTLADGWMEREPSDHREAHEHYNKRRGEAVSWFYSKAFKKGANTEQIVDDFWVMAWNAVLERLEAKYEQIAAERVSAAIESFIEQVEAEYNNGGENLADYREAMRSVAKRGFRK
jgi:hypothetical protein